MSQGKMLSKAIAIASLAFEGKLDKGGNPYILHCLFVMNELIRSNMPEDVVSAGVLHDLVEDCEEWTVDRLRFLGFSERTVELIEMVTHRAQEDYLDYIVRVAQDDDAIHIKLYDLTHNSRIDRLKGLRDRDFKRLVKYQSCYHHLSLILNTHDPVAKAKLVDALRKEIIVDEAV